MEHVRPMRSAELGLGNVPENCRAEFRSGEESAVSHRVKEKIDRREPSSPFSHNGQARQSNNSASFLFGPAPTQGPSPYSSRKPSTTGCRAAQRAGKYPATNVAMTASPTACMSAPIGIII